MPTQRVIHKLFTAREMQEEGRTVSTVDEAEMEASKLLESSWWTNRDGPLPINPFELASGLGIRVQMDSLPSDQSGKIVFPTDGSPLIVVNRADSENRQRFTCAHEIGHYVRRGQDPDRTTFVDYRDTLAGLGRDPEEIFANQFAAALLMPASQVKRFRQDDEPASTLARRFGTSVQAMELRLRNLHLA